MYRQNRRNKFSRGRSGKFGRPQRSRRNRNNVRRGDKLSVGLFIKKAETPKETGKYLNKYKFSDFNLDSRVLANVAAKGYVNPTPIQDQAIIPILRGQDVVGIANTGTGKTAAFLLPMVQRIIQNRLERVLIVVPTRELANQINDEFIAFARGLNIFSACLVGGVNINPQIRQLRRENHVIIGTPGRLKDLIERKALSLSSTTKVVLDEADRMLDMGFIKDVRYLLSKTNSKRQTMFFSATMSHEIKGLINEFLRDPVSVSVKTQDTAKNVEQDIVRTNGRGKFESLCELLASPGFEKTLVFGRTKHGVQKLSAGLCKHGLRAEAIHGNKSQRQREYALGLFRKGAVRILVATDVAARGLDIAGISHVINYDIPATYDDYVHRIGRTGRGEAAGKALTFVE